MKPHVSLIVPLTNGLFSLSFFFSCPSFVKYKSPKNDQSLCGVEGLIAAFRLNL